MTRSTDETARPTASAARRDCAADPLACIHRIIADVRRLELDCQYGDEPRDYYVALHKAFRGIVERELRIEFQSDELEVFWATRQKPQGGELPREIPSGRLQFVNKAIVELNARYNSMPLLSKMARFAFARSHIFQVTSMTAGVRLQAYSLSGANPTATAVSHEFVLPFTGRMSLEEFYTTLADGDADSPEKIRGRITEQIDHWTVNQPWPEEEVLDAIASEDDNIQRHARSIPWQRHFEAAAKHFALIALYQRNNPYGSTTSYLLASGLRGTSDASLAVFWPDSLDDVPIDLLVLLQLLLRDNAVSLLALRRAFSGTLLHLGHSLKNQLDTVQDFLDKHAGAEMRTRGLKLTDMSDVLQLGGAESIEDVRSSSKRRRFLEYERPGAAELDLLRLLQGEWREAMGRKRDCRDGDRTFEAYCELTVIPLISRATIGWPLEDKEGRRCRLCIPAYRELFFELLLNVRKYGCFNILPDESRDGLPVVSITCYVGEARVAADRVFLTLGNEVHPEKPLPEELHASKWTNWPAELSQGCEGPALAVSVFRRLEQGNLVFRRKVAPDGTEWLLVGATFSGMTVER